MPSRSATRKDLYGGDYATERKRWVPKVAAGGVVCRRCGHPLTPGTPWDLGHSDSDPAGPRHPEHRHRTSYCVGNRAAGTIKGNRARGRRRRRATGMMAIEDW